MGLDLDDYDMFEGFEQHSDFAKGKLKARLKNVGSKIKTGVKKTATKVKEGANKVIRAGARILPITLAGRGGFIYILKRNGFGLADRLAPLYLTSSDARLRKYKPDAVKSVKNAQSKIEKAWLNVGGKISPFREAILEGAGRKPRIFKKGDKSFDGTQTIYSFDSNGLQESYVSFYNEEQSNFFDPATLGMIASGLTVVASFVKLLSANKVPTQPFIEGTPEAKEMNITQNITPESIEPNAPSFSDDGTKLVDPKTGETISNEELLKQGTPDSEGLNGKEAKFLGMPKKIGIGVTIGVGVLAIAGILIAVSRKK